MLFIRQEYITIYTTACMLGNKPTYSDYMRHVLVKCMTRDGDYHSLKWVLQTNNGYIHAIYVTCSHKARNKSHGAILRYMVLKFQREK